MKKIIASFILLVGISAGMYGQKFGHVNSTEIIMSLPEVKAADNELASYQKQLLEKGQDMVKKFEAAYTIYGQKANAGELSGIEMQQEEARLAQQQQDIQKYELEVQQMLAAKRAEVYQPILDKVQDVVQTIGKEMGYTMIFDSGSGGLVYVEDSVDLMPIVKERLGIAN